MASAFAFLKQQGFNRVFADLPDQVKPPKLNGYIPDIYALRIKPLLSGLPLITDVFIVEVETEDTKNAPVTIFQHLALGKWAIDNKAMFRAVVVH